MAQLKIFSWRPIHMRDFAPGACSRGTLRDQSFSVCTNDFMGILHLREQNFHPAKCSTIFNRLNIWEQVPGANWANLKMLSRVYWHVQNEPGACSGRKPLVCIGLKGRQLLVRLMCRLVTEKWRDWSRKERWRSSRNCAVRYGPEVKLSANLIRQSRRFILLTQR